MRPMATSPCIESITPRQSPRPKRICIAVRDVAPASASQNDADATDVGSYIPDTCMPKNGWFQFCNGCRQPTGYSIEILPQDTAVPLCRRCQQRYWSMRNGVPCPSAVPPMSANEEPLATWAPTRIGRGTVRMNDSMRHMIVDQAHLKFGHAERIVFNG